MNCLDFLFADALWLKSHARLFVLCDGMYELASNKVLIVLCDAEDSKPSSFLHSHGSSLLDYGIHGYGHSLTRSSPWSLKSRNDNIPTFQLEVSSISFILIYNSFCLLANVAGLWQL